MASVKELRSELLEEYGCEEYPVVKSKRIDSLTNEALIAILNDRNLEIEDCNDRKFMEDMLRAAVDGSEHVVTVDMVKISEMEREELETALEKIRSSRRTVREVQQELAVNCGYADDVIWDLFSHLDADAMKNKIKQLIPDQEKGQKAVERTRENMFNSVWAQRKYNNKQSVTYIFYVMVTSEEDFNLAKDSKKFSCHPVFRCRKCIKDCDTSDCCMLYVDEMGRVYRNWKSFIEDNVLPPGTMIAPRRGVYNFDKNNDVILDVYCTPSGTAGAQALNVAQTGSAVLGVGAACVPIAAVMGATIAAPVLAGAAIVGLGVGAFSAITSALNLTDRSKHEQSISITDSQARANYLGIAGGVVGMAAAGVTRVMTSMAVAGKATVGIEMLVNGINISSIVLSGTGVANGVLDMILKYNDDDQITTLDVLQLSASLVLFTHSVYNFQLASQIATEARTNSIKNYRETLSNRQRKMFDKMSKETVRMSGETQGKIDIIRNINKIPDRQYLNDLFKINKQLNENKVRPAFTSSAEGVVLNNEVPVDTGVLRQSVQHQKGPNILEQVTKPIPSTHNSGETPTIQTSKEARLLFSTGNGIGYRTDVNLEDVLNENQPNTSGTGGLRATLNTLVVTLLNGASISLSQYGEKFLQNIADGRKFQDVILSMAENLPEKTFRFILKMAQEFIETKLEPIIRQLKIFIPTESVLFRMIEQVLWDFKQDLSYERISTHAKDIQGKMSSYYLSLNPNISGSGKTLTKCQECGGTFFICNL